MKNKSTMINEEIAVVLCFAICLAVLVFAVMFKCTGKENTNEVRIISGESGQLTTQSNIETNKD